MDTFWDPRLEGNGYDFPALVSLLDFINLMAYDFHGPWSDHAGHNSPLFLNPADPGHEGSWKTSIDLYLNYYHVPAGKLNIGTAFYGYEFTTARKLWGACQNCASTTFSRNYGGYIKQRVNRQGWVRHFDRTAEAPYLLRTLPSQPGFITYDDPDSTARKVAYALCERNLGGVGMWHLGADYDGHSQDLFAAMYRAFQKCSGITAAYGQGSHH